MYVYENTDVPLTKSSYPDLQKVFFQSSIKDDVEKVVLYCNNVARSELCYSVQEALVIKIILVRQRI